jgi:hypothetical protein
MTGEYEFHEAANIMPLDEENLPGLAEDIRRHGLIDAIELLDGKIIDGRRRYLSCREAGREPRFVEVKLNEGQDPVDYVWSKQNRRELTKGQKAMAAAKSTPLKEKYAAEAAGRKTGRPKKEVQHVALINPDAGKTRDKVAAKFDVSHRLVEAGEKILKHGVPEARRSQQKAK